MKSSLGKEKVMDLLKNLMDSDGTANKAVEDVLKDSGASSSSKPSRLNFLIFTIFQ